MANRLLTIPAFFASTLANRGDEVALGTIRGGDVQWHTWREIWNEVQALVASLRAAGIQPGDRVAQVSENRYEWVITDLALHLAGAVHVPIHVTLSGEQIAEQIAVSEARHVFVSGAELLAKLSERLTNGETVFVHDEQAIGEEKPLLGKPDFTFPPLAPSPQLDDLATILFTSGTTGRPRGVMLSQRNLASNAAAMADALGGDSDYTRLNLLPFSHVYARTCDLYTWVYRGSRLVLGEGRETLVRDCQLVQPTVLNAVPFVYQRIADRVRASGADDEAAALAATFGGRVKQLCCGGAALAADVEAWYAERGLPILPGYGLTEASPVISVSTPAARKSGQRRSAARRRRRADRRRRRGARPWAKRHARLLAGRGGDRGSALRRMASYGRLGRARRGGIPHHSRPEEGVNCALDRQKSVAIARGRPAHRVAARGTSGGFR